VIDALRWVQTAHPFWNVSGGRDHVWIFSHDIGGCLAPLALAQVSIILQPTGEMPPGRTRSLVRWRTHAGFQDRLNRWPCFTSGKDVVIPPMVTADFVAARDSGFATALRRWRSYHSYTRWFPLASFRGSIPTDKRSRKYSQGVRQELLGRYGNSTTILIKSAKFRPKWLFPVWRYHLEMAQSEFCLAPSGWQLWTPRLAQAAVAGCIPVILADGIVLPFEPHLTHLYERAVLRLPQCELDSLEANLRAVTLARRQAMREALEQLWPALVYASTGLQDDVKHMNDANWNILKALSLRTGAAQQERGRERREGIVQRVTPNAVHESRTT